MLIMLIYVKFYVVILKFYFNYYDKYKINIYLCCKY